MITLVDLGGASPEQVKLHTELVAARHNFLSHTGSSELCRQSAQVILQDPAIENGVFGVFASQTIRSVPPRKELEAICELLSILIDSVQASMRRVHERLRAEVANMNLDELYARSRTPGASPRTFKSI